jgi:Fe2+ transport protein
MKIAREQARQLVRRGAGLLAIGVVVAGCASANKTTSTSTTSAAGSSSSSSGSAGMAGMNMGSSTSGAAPSVNGIKAVPTQPLASSEWQGMRISAEATTAVPFVIYNGTSEQLVKPGPNTSFHLMVMLSDAQTGVAIPYAGVWATISKDGKTVYDERQWPMISRYMGPHYGNDVSVPGAGTYQLSLLISPPVSARHVEYENVWLQPHRVTMTFHWKPIS